MIELRDVSFRYAQGGAAHGLDDIRLTVGAGEVVVLTGGSGCGKTTLTRVVNGLIPHFHEGRLTGEVVIAGRSASKVPPAEAADRVASVFQNPRSQFFTTDVGSELAFAAENLGHPREQILQRVSRIADELSLDDLLGRSIFGLSGGQKQKVACGSAWVAAPRVVVLDEPSSNLDDSTVEELRTMILRWKRQGCAVIVAEHRLHYLQGVADRWLLMDRGRITAEFSASEMATMTDSVAAAHGLRSPHPVPIPAPGGHPADSTVVLEGFRRTFPGTDRPALDLAGLVLPRCGVVAITGSNGAGKTTLARALVGLDSRTRGTLIIDGERRGHLRRMATSAMVMQDVNHQLFAESVVDEVLLGHPETSQEEATALLGRLDLAEVGARHPLSLSGGQKQRVAIAAALAADAQVIVFDEPTSGLDRRHMEEVARQLGDLAAEGRLVVVITHDPELIAACGTHLVRLEEGRVTVSGRLSEVPPQGAGS